MKLLFCDFCGEVIPLEYETILCRCGRVGGRYAWEGDDSAIIYLSEISTMAHFRAIAISNEFLYGKSDDHRTWIIPWNHPKLWYYIEENDTVMHEGRIM